MKKLLIAFLSPLLLFGDPTVLSTPGVNATLPKVVIAADTGDAVAAWLEGGVIQTRTQLFGQSWGDMAAIPSTGVSAFLINIDDSGNATAIWEQGGVIKTSSKSIAGSWSDAQDLSLSGATQPSFDVDNSGNIVAVWIRGGNVESATKMFGGSWSVVSIILATQPSNPKVSIGQDGSVFAIWHGYDTSVYRIYTASKTLALGLWSVQTALTDTTKNAMSPSIDIGPNGEAAAIWYSFDLANQIYSNVIIQLATKAANGSWSSATNATEKSYIRAEFFNADIHFDDYGNLIAVWLNSYDGEYFAIESNVKQYGCDWAEVSTPGGSIYSRTCDYDVSSHGNGNVCLVNPESNRDAPNQMSIKMTKTDLTSYKPNWWASPTTVSTGSTNGNPSVEGAIVGSNSLEVIVWENVTDGVIAVHSINNIGSVFDPATNGAVQQLSTDYGVFTEYYNVLTWDASTSPGLQGYAIFRNNILVGQVGSGVLTYTDHNQPQGVAAEYWVVAYESWSNLSARLTINYAP